MHQIPQLHFSLAPRLGAGLEIGDFLCSERAKQNSPGQSGGRSLERRPGLQLMVHGDRNPGRRCVGLVPNTLPELDSVGPSGPVEASSWMRAWKVVSLLNPGWLHMSHVQGR
jgi:hypothetical protein